ncbi:hypothetical protein DFQ28_002734 [Apophysomyces sp. BC1034]|nr:hypothetical protein DFQ30_005568 [Apophysomyces sp. BC1015]KAG0179508.1 hypothetical protein DFQ29_002015 [Apophysomyces sp. BC1021]KAG0189913.1 hypothetical protein DFQ28_002734 [Apophysomyces sp. BC1034]
MYSIRLSAELARLWTMKPDLAAKQTIQEKKMDKTDEHLTQLLISLAILEAREFDILSFDEVEQLKKQHADLQRRISHATEQLGLESKIKNLTRSLASLDRRRSGQVRCDQAVRLVDDLVVQLTTCQAQASATKFKLLQHTAGILSLGIQKLESAQCMSNKSSTHDEEIQAKNREIAELRSELEQITNTLDMMLRRTALQDDDDNTPPDSAYGKSTDDLCYMSCSSETLHTSLSNSLLTSVEKQLYSYKSRMRLLENQAEKHQLVSMSEQKLRIQLRAAEDERDAAEAQCQRLMSKEPYKINQLDPQLAWLKVGVDSLSDEPHTSNDQKNLRPFLDRISELELQLRQTEDQKEYMQVQLARSARQITNLTSSRSDLELKCSRAQSQTAAFLYREKTLKIEMEQYRNEAFLLRIEKEKWRQAHRRESALNLQAGNNRYSNQHALQKQYEQLLEEQQQEFETQLKESQSLLDKSKQESEQLRTERDQWKATSNDFENLVREKIKTLDYRDGKIAELESELVGTQTTQRALSAREAAWMEKTDSLETNLEGMLKEFDRLTSTVMDLEMERPNYERRIDQLVKTNQHLEAELVNERVNHLGNSSDTPTTASLRKEFRALISDLKDEKQRLLAKEASEKKQLENIIKDMKHERDMARYDRINKGVQTPLIP